MSLTGGPRRIKHSGPLHNGRNRAAKPNPNNILMRVGIPDISIIPTQSNIVPLSMWNI